MVISYLNNNFDNTDVIKRSLIVMTDFSSLETHIKELEEKLLKPDIRTSKSDLEELLSNEFMEFTSSGNVINKQDCLDGLQTNRMELYDFSIKVLSEELILSKFRLNIVDKNNHSLRSSIWKYSDGRWQMLFHQGTLTQNE
jgi:hypothetical protein